MKIRFITLLALLIGGTLGGCGPSGPQGPKPIPSPVVTDAVFYDNKYHDNVYIQGEYFKMSSDNRNDVIASLDGSNWKPARKIFDSSSTAYKASLPYDASYPKVWVRVYGMNREYSEPFLVH